MNEYEEWEKVVAEHWSQDLLDTPEALVSVIETKISRAVLAERRRIIDLIDREVSEWLSHDGSCDCELRGEEGKRLIELIKGENE
jgi:hypothetical protein